MSSSIDGLQITRLFVVVLRCDVDDARSSQPARVVSSWLAGWLARNHDSNGLERARDPIDLSSIKRMSNGGGGSSRRPLGSVFAFTFGPATRIILLKNYRTNARARICKLARACKANSTRDDLLHLSRLLLIEWSTGCASGEHV